MLGRLIRSRARHSAKPDHCSLRFQIASMLATFFTIRGQPIFLNTQTAVVMRRHFETFVTADLRGIENPQSVIATVYLKDIECYQGFKEIQSDNLLRGSAFGELALNHLADQVTEELLRQVTKDP